MLDLEDMKLLNTGSIASFLASLLYYFAMFAG